MVPTTLPQKYVLILTFEIHECVPICKKGLCRCAYKEYQDEIIVGYMDGSSIQWQVSS